MTGDIEAADVRDQARAILGDAAGYFDFAGKSPEEVKRAVVEAAIGECADKPAPFVDAAFATIAASGNNRLLADRILEDRRRVEMAEYRARRIQADFERAAPEGAKH